MVKSSELAKFSRWMVGRGLTLDTAALYSRCVRLCLGDVRGPLFRVANGELAPKTRRTNKAALCAWADFNDDKDLRKQLKEIRLPPPDRVTEKRALDFDDWRRVCQIIDTAPVDEPVRYAIGMVCRRGFRIGDVMRLDRRTVRDGLSSGVLKYLAKGQRRVPWTVTDQFAPYLQWFMEQSKWNSVADLVAPNFQKRHQGAVLTAQRAFPVVLDAAGVDREGVSLHIMRRTYAWHYLKACGGDPVKLQKHMAWKSILTAMQYVDQSQREELDSIAEEMAAMLG